MRFVEVFYAVETSACTDTFLLCQFFIGYYVLTIQFLPCPDNVDVVEGQSYPVLVMRCKVIGRLATKGLQLLGVTSVLRPCLLRTSALLATGRTRCMGGRHKCYVKLSFVIKSALYLAM